MPLQQPDPDGADRRRACASGRLRVTNRGRALMTVGAPLHVLFVDEASTGLELAQRELNASGLTYSWARVDSAETLRDALTARRPDLIISDVAVPGFSVLEALSLARAHVPDVPFIILAGSKDEQTAVGCLDGGAWDYVLKNHIVRLPHAVRHALARHRALAEAVEARDALRDSEARCAAQAKKMEAVERLAGGVSHDLNNQLTGILGFCDLLLGSLPLDLPDRADVIQIQAIAERASMRARQLLALSRRQKIRMLRSHTSGQQPSACVGEER